jgi:hypothetical protein
MSYVHDTASAADADNPREAAVKPTATALAELSRCACAEKLAWNEVRGSLPGARGFDAVKWSRWVHAVANSDRARDRVREEILNTRFVDNRTTAWTGARHRST